MASALANRLKDLRYEKNLKQSEVAKKLNISQVAYGRFELGKRKPKEEHLRTLSEFYDVSLDYLIGETDDRKGKSYAKYLILDEDFPTEAEAYSDGTKDMFYEMRAYSFENRVKIRDLILQLRIGNTTLYDEFEKLSEEQKRKVRKLNMQIRMDEIDSGHIKGISYEQLPDILKYGKTLD